jgi:fused signal recognition particle receptor
MFNFIKNSLKKIYAHVTSRLGILFGRTTIDRATLEELKVILLSADVGVPTTKIILSHLEQQYNRGLLREGSSLKEALEEQLLAMLGKVSVPLTSARISMLVGINGSGKTTAAAKLAYQQKETGKRVLLVAADTFRAAATEQLKTWATRIGVDIVTGKEGDDPSAVIFKGSEQFKQGGYDCLIIDTAGRLHTRTHLMQELAKIKRVIDRHFPGEPRTTLLTIDSVIGQNSFEQARLFKECTDVTGIILTKMDGTAKGGIVFAIVHELAIPIVYITYGEAIEQIKHFEKKEYVENLLESS